MLCLREWRRWIRPLVGVLYVLVLCVGLPLMIVGFHVWSVERHQQAWYIAGVFVLLAIPISIWGILQHLIHYTQPSLQRYIVRILWMVPIYAANAWLALRFKESAIYLDTARECYEAYVIYNFMSYLMAFLRQGHPDLEGTIEEKPQVKHLIPFCCFPPWKMGRPMINNCKHGVLQYAVVRPITTIVALLCQWGGVYHEGDFDFHAAWAYLVIINNISQIWAMYCLVLFYKVTREELAPVKPVGKFMCVKAIVFLTFWQAVFIAILVKTGVIKERQSWVIYDVDDVANGLQDFIICIEMFLAAIAHYFCFSHKPYVDYAAGYANCYDSLVSMFNVSDVRDDVVEHVRHVGKAATGIVRAPLRRKPPGSQGERTPLLDGTIESGGEEAGALAQSEFRELKSVLSGQDEIPGELLDDSLDLDLDPTAGLHVGQQSQSVPSSENLISLDLSVDLGTESEFHSRSYTASMNNYLEFEESMRGPTPTEPLKDPTPTPSSE